MSHEDIFNFSIDFTNREIYFLSNNSSPLDDFEISSSSASDIIKAIKILEKINNEDITIHFGCSGGNIEWGLAIYDAIHTCNCIIKIIGYGHLYSMAAIILQAADQRTLMPNCSIMIHFGSIIIDDGITAAESYIRYDKKVQENILNILSNKVHNTIITRGKKARISTIKKDIISKIEKTSDWYLSSSEAVNFGLADSVYGESN